MSDSVRHVFRYEDLEFWAERGRVYIANLRKADEGRHICEVVRTVEPKEFLKRAIAVWVMHQGLLPSEVRKVNKLREEAEIVTKQALKQAEELGINDVVKLGKPELVIPGARYIFKKKPPKEIILNGYEIVREFTNS